MRNSPPIIGSSARPRFFDPHQQENNNENGILHRSDKASINLTIPSSGNNIMIKEDRLKRLDFLKNELISKPPPISVIVSWLAINGQVIGSQGICKKDEKSFLRIPKRPGIGSGITANNKIEIRGIECHHLSKEQQLFFEVLTNSAIKCDTEKLNAFINILQNQDAGLIRLVPEIVSFISMAVNDNVNGNKNKIDLNFLYCLMRIAESLILSRFLSDCLEQYLQQFMPPILTCCMKENLSSSPTENHWNLRNKSAKIIYFILIKFGKKFQMVRNKVIRSLIHYFNNLTLTFKTHYGAITAMKELGVDALETGLLPHIKKYVNIKLKPVIEGQQIVKKNNNKIKENRMDGGNGNKMDDMYHIKQNVIKQYEAKMVGKAILESLWLCHQHQTNNANGIDFNSDKNKKTLEIFHQLQEMFGESLIPFNPIPPNCQNYFI